MSCRSIADILRGLGEVPPSELAPIEVADDPPVPFGTPWVDADRIRVSLAKDFLERTDDDRSKAQRREQSGWQALLAAKRLSPNRFTFGAQAKAKSEPKPKVKAKKERTPELRAYFREYGRMWRAKKKAEAQTGS